MKFQTPSTKRQRSSKHQAPSSRQTSSSKLLAAVSAVPAQVVGAPGRSVGARTCSPQRLKKALVEIMPDTVQGCCGLQARAPTDTDGMRCHGGGARLMECHGRHVAQAASNARGPTSIRASWRIASSPLPGSTESGLPEPGCGTAGLRAPRPAGCPELGAWSLVLGAWCLCGAWCLVFGASAPRPARYGGGNHAAAMPKNCMTTS